MERDYAIRKRKKWGEQHCNHTALDKETDRGKDTGKWACLNCGRTMDPIEWDHLRYGLSKPDDAAEPEKS